MHKTICHALGRINVHYHMKTLVGRVIKVLLKNALMRGKKGKKFIEIIPRGYDSMSATFL